MYSRQNPSARYLQLLEQYKSLHTHGVEHLGCAPEDTFPGFSLFSQATHIKALIDRTGAETILDYGSGKGKQYEPRAITIPNQGKWPSILEYWDITEVTCYDPNYPLYQALPTGTFDGVVCTDVLEHCPEEDIPWIVEEIFSYATEFVYLNIACYPAQKRLPSGENAHCTIQGVEWWEPILTAAASRHHGLFWEARLAFKVIPSDESKKQLLEERRIANF